MSAGSDVYSRRVHDYIVSSGIALAEDLLGLTMGIAMLASMTAAIRPRPRAGVYVGTLP